MKSSLSKLALTLCAAISLAAPAVCGSADSKGSELISLVPSKLKWNPAPSVAPGAELAMIEGDLKKAAPFTFRLKLPANSKIAVHTHPLVERVTVISGTFYLGTGKKFDAGKANAYPAGGAVFIPQGMPMFAFTKDEGAILQIHGTGPWGINFLNPEDAPKKK